MPATKAAFSTCVRKWIKVSLSLSLSLSLSQDLIGFLEKTYCGSVGIEFSHLQCLEEIEWLSAAAENPKVFTFTSLVENGRVENGRCCHVQLILHDLKLKRKPSMTRLTRNKQIAFVTILTRETVLFTLL